MKLKGQAVQVLRFFLFLVLVEYPGIPNISSAKAVIASAFDRLLNFLARSC